MCVMFHLPLWILKGMFHQTVKCATFPWRMLTCVVESICGLIVSYFKPIPSVSELSKHVYYVPSTLFLKIWRSCFHVWLNLCGVSWDLARVILVACVISVGVMATTSASCLMVTFIKVWRLWSWVTSFGLFKFLRRPDTRGIMAAKDTVIGMNEEYSDDEQPSSSHSQKQSWMSWIWSWLAYIPRSCYHKIPWGHENHPHQALCEEEETIKPFHDPNPDRSIWKPSLTPSPPREDYRHSLRGFGSVKSRPSPTFDISPHQPLIHDEHHEPGSSDTVMQKPISKKNSSKQPSHPRSSPSAAPVPTITPSTPVTLPSWIKWDFQTPAFVKFHPGQQGPIACGNATPCLDLMDINVNMNLIKHKEKHLFNLVKNHPFQLNVYIPSLDEDNCNTFMILPNQDQQTIKHVHGRLLKLYQDAETTSSIQTCPIANVEVLGCVIAEVRCMYSSVTVRVTDTEVLFVGSGEKPALALSDFTAMMQHAR